MRSIVNSIVLISLFAAPFAQAQEKPLLVRTNEEIQAEALKADGEQAGRIVVETLVGGAGALAGGFAGFGVGYAGGDLASGGLGLMGGVALGAWLGTSLGGNLAGGNGNMGAAFLGTALGSAASVVAILALAQTNSPPLILGATVVFPLAGAIIGYEVSQTPRQAAFGSSLRFVPSVSMTRDGKGATAGLAGTF